MKRTMLIAASLCLVLMMGLSEATLAQSPASKSRQKKVPASAEKGSFDARVREYILSNPEVIQEAMVALQRKEEKRRKDSIAESMIRSREQIYSDAFTPVGGNPDGDVSIVVFYDYFCGYCKKTLPELETYIASDPTIKVVYKEFPILGESSMIAAKAAIAASRQGKFAAFHRALLEANSVSDESIKAIAERLGLDHAQLEKDMNDPKTLAAIERNIRLAAALNINGTPAYLIGDQIVPGAITQDALANLVKDQRAKLHQLGADRVATTGRNPR